jgi:threonine/homoserine/homoserine lactone efflux protein
MTIFNHMSSASSLAYLCMGAIFGLTAGISPGPLLALVISETLKHGRREGFKVAAAPLLTDLPIIVVTWFILAELSSFGNVMSVISFSGGIYFAYLGYKTIKVEGMDKDVEVNKPESLKKGVTANLLNPNPYIFWLTAGMPTAFKAYGISLLTAVLYFALFYITLVGSKILVAFLVDRTRSFIVSNIYRMVMVVLGAVLFVFAATFIFEGFRILYGNHK